MGPFSRRLSILIYHRVVPEPDPLFPEQVCEKEFDCQLSVLARWFEVMPLREATARLSEGTLPKRAACVTFDDGYADNAEVALPLLRRHGVPAAFFLATGFIDGGVMWNDSVIESVRRARGDALDVRWLGFDVLAIASVELRRQAIEKLISALKYLPPEERQRKVDRLVAETGCELPATLMMSKDQVRRLQGSGMDIGAHTVSHPILARLDPAQAGNEIGESKRELESITGTPVTLFAYPNGKPGVDYRAEHVEMVRKLGFKAAVSTAWGVAGAGDDLLQLPRFTPWDKTPGKFLLRLLHNTFRTNVKRV